MSLYKTRAAVQSWKKGEVVDLDEKEAATIGPVFLDKLSDKQVKKADVKVAEEPAEESASKKKKKK